MMSASCFWVTPYPETGEPSSEPPILRVVNCTPVNGGTYFWEGGEGTEFICTLSGPSPFRYAWVLGATRYAEAEANDGDEAIFEVTRLALDAEDDDNNRAVPMILRLCPFSCDTCDETCPRRVTKPWEIRDW